jgi:hypothetical protein
VRDFLAQNSAIFVIELGDFINARWVLCDEGAFDEHRYHFTEVEL